MSLLAFINSPLSLVVILIIVLLLFGKNLPSLFRSLGRSVTEFKKGVNEIGDESDTAETTEKKS